MGTSSYLAPAAAVCVLLLLSACSSTKPDTSLENTSDQTASIPEALPLTQGKNQPVYRSQKPQHRPTKRTWVAQARPQIYERRDPTPRIQRAMYIPSISSDYSIDQDFDTWSRVFRHFHWLIIQAILACSNLFVPMPKTHKTSVFSRIEPVCFCI